MATYCVGDIHGTYLALVQVLERAGFIPEEDKLITLGDIVDGGPQSCECVEYLLGLPTAVHVQGNHDAWCHEWLKGNPASAVWLERGGRATWASYQGRSLGTQRRHKELFFDRQVPYHEEDNCLFVHGGYYPWEPIADQEPSYLYWDRELWLKAETHGWSAVGYTTCYIGHTTVQRYASKEPLWRNNILNLDTGAGHTGRLSCIRLEDGQLFQSEPIPALYPNRTTPC